MLQGKPRQGSNEYMVSRIRETASTTYEDLGSSPSATKGAKLAALLLKQPGYRCSFAKAESVCDTKYIPKVVGAHPSMWCVSDVQFLDAAKIILGEPKQTGGS